MTLLDKLPDSEWFLCLPLYLSVYCIAALGIIHVLFWVKTMRVYRSELFVFMYVLIIFWSVLSAALLYAIVMESHCIYSFWIWYTLVFCVAMAGMMILLFCGFCVLGMRRKCIIILIGLLYYLVTMYFAIVVNRQRIKVFGLQAKCGSCAINHVYPNDGHDATTQTATEYRVMSQYTVHPTMRHDTPVAQESITAGTVMMTALIVSTTVLSTPTTVLTTPTTVLTTPTTALTTTATALTTSAMSANASQARKMLSPTMAGYLEEDTPATRLDREWQTRKVEDVLTPMAPADRDAAIAMLSELLVTTNECRKPRKPAHGRFKVNGRRSKTSLKITLHCEQGYRASSVATQCKYNWWDRPIPQCRARKPPDPLPLPGGGCMMPGYPQHGEYRVAGHERARPGDRVSGDNIVLLVSCDEPYRAVDPYVMCVEGRWRHGAPKCLKHCKLTFDLSVEYKCLKEFKDEFLDCAAWQPDGAVVAAACRPGLAHRGPFRYMRCHGDTWDHTVSCLPNANFTR